MLNNLLKILIFIALLLNLSLVFAESTVNITTDNNEIGLNENLSITVDIQTNSTGSVELSDIKGLEQFQRIGQQSSNQTSLIDGELFGKFQLIITLKPLNIGEFNIGPVEVKLGNETIKSDLLNINIINKPIKKTENHKSEIQKKEKDDDIKTIKNPNSEYYNFFLFQGLILFLLIGLYLYLRFRKKDDLSIDNKEEQELNEKNIKEKIVNKLRHLINGSEIMNKSEFYENLNGCFKEYFAFIGFNETETLTLKEIKNLNLDKKLISLFEKSYLNEFSDKKDTPKTRQTLINSFLEIIK